MKNILVDIQKSLTSKSFYSALFVCLTVPDICGKMEGKGQGVKRYSEWFDKYLKDTYEDYMTGQDFYALRCACLHEGNENVETQHKHDILDRFIFTSNTSAHCTRSKNCKFGNVRYDQKEVIQLSVERFCRDIINATEKWLDDLKENNGVQGNLRELIHIYEGGVSVGGMRIQ